jgi:CubicO group peptidase (beta-lactamase class C family)
MPGAQNGSAAAPSADVEGGCDPRFALVREAFWENFRHRGELGGAVCVMVGDRIVADLRGGWADLGCTRRWRPDTLVNMFSVGKGLVAICAARLAGQGRLNVDAAVASYWPEFGAASKDGNRRHREAPKSGHLAAVVAQREQHRPFPGR